MKNNILNHFAFNDLRIHKKDTIISMITIFIIAFVVMFINLMTPSLQLNRYFEHQRQFGTYDYSTSIETIEEIKNLKLRLDNKDIPINDSRLTNCIVFTSGETLFNEQINSFQGNSEIMSVNIKEGRMPTNENEVAVKESVLTNWGYQKELNTSIEFSYILKEKSSLKQFKLVGILKETGETDIAVSNLDYSKIILYIDKNNTGAKIRNQDHNFSTAISGELIDEYNDVELSYLTVIIELIILALSFSLLSGLTLSSFEKKERDYTLLRSIGITKRQMYYIIFVQLVILSSIPILLSIGLIYCLSLVFPILINWPIQITFPLSSILWSAVTIFAVAFVSYFIPAKNACKRAISGSFELQEFQYFYYRYKKLHRLSSFYLGYRQLISMKKKMISKVFFIFIIVLCSMKIIGSYTIFAQIDEEVKNEINISELTLDFAPAEAEETLYKQDFQFIKPYSKAIHYYNYVLENDLKHEYFMKVNDEYFPNLYCLNDSLKEKYHLDDIKDNQIVLSNSYLNANDFSNYKENDTIGFLNKEYELVKIIEDDFHNIAIVNENSYKRYGNPNTFQKVIVELSSLQQRTKLYIQEYQEMAKLKEKYYISDIYYDMNILAKNNMVQEHESSFDSMSIIIISIAVALAIVYVYQFSFELLKQKEDIGSYQLLGLSKREIRNIYFYKSLIIGSVGMFFGGLYYYLECYYSLNMLSYEYIMYKPMNIVLLIIIPFIIIVLIVAISLIPLRRILKSDGLENKNTRE